jgi:peptidoglycan hydrolase-like protein with peptidoglycan-binding domain
MVKIFPILLSIPFMLLGPTWSARGDFYGAFLEYIGPHEILYSHSNIANINKVIRFGKQNTYSTSCTTEKETNGKKQPKDFLKLRLTKDNLIVKNHKTTAELYFILEPKFKISKMRFKNKTYHYSSESDSEVFQDDRVKKLLRSYSIAWNSGKIFKKGIKVGIYNNYNSLIDIFINSSGFDRKNITVSKNDFIIEQIIKKNDRYHALVKYNLELFVVRKTYESVGGGGDDNHEDTGVNENVEDIGPASINGYGLVDIATGVSTYEYTRGNFNFNSNKTTVNIKQKCDIEGPIYTASDLKLDDLVPIANTTAASPRIKSEKDGDEKQRRAQLAQQQKAIVEVDRSLRVPRLDLEGKTAEFGKKKLQREGLEKPLRFDLALRFQRALQSLGLYSGKIDGVLGVKSKAAIKAWRQRSGHASTGGGVLIKQIVGLERDASIHLADLERGRKADAEKKAEAVRVVEAERDRKVQERHKTEAARKIKAANRLAGANRIKNPDAIAVVIGNRDYTGGVPAVEFADRDADGIRRFIIQGLGYREGNIIDLRDATYAQLARVFGTKDTHKGQLFDYVRAEMSDVLVFYSGHGVPGLKDHRGYLLPVDGDANRAELTAYPIDILLGNLAKVPSKSLMVFLDTCFSGNSPKGMIVKGMSGLLVEVQVSNNAAERMVVLTAAQSDEVASWDEQAKHGLFTKHLLEALAGAADQQATTGNHDRKVTLGEVKAYLDREMTYQARRRFSRDQHATVTGDLKTVLTTY